MERQTIVRCGQCGAQVDGGWRFCNQCRGELVVPPPKTAPPAPPVATHVVPERPVATPPLSSRAVPPAPPISVSSPPSPVATPAAPPAAPGPVRRANRFVAGLPPPVVVTATVVLAVCGLVGTAWLLTPKAQSLPPDRSAAGAPPLAAPAALPHGMVLVPAGEYTIGRDDGDKYERPGHTVSIRAFLIDRCEVTRAEYRKFLDATGRSAPQSWSNVVGPETLPATGVTWADASAYAAWAGKRLPSEQEWEAAARGTDGRRYPWAGQWRADGANALAGSRNEMVPVGSYPAGASPCGALDMVGNAWEWTASDPTPYPGGEIFDPTDSSKIIRGGCFTSPAEQLTATFRGWNRKTGGEYGETGFRCVMDAP